MRARNFLSIGFLLGFLFVFAATTTAATPLVGDHTGTYEFVVSDIPDQDDVEGTMTVSKKDGKVSVNFSSSAGDIDLEDVKLEGDKLTGSIEVEGLVLKLSGKFTKDGFKGQFDTEYGAMGISAEKKK
jgi:hypothetical protein